MRVFICGVTGQDGAYLARHLLESGCEVWGSSRFGEKGRIAGLDALGITRQIRLLAMDPANAQEVGAALEAVRADAVVNLAGQSSVAASFDRPLEALQGSAVAAVNVLEWIRRCAPATRLVNAGSGDCFGETGDRPAEVDSPFAPRSPYGIGKCAVADLTRLYRMSYGLSVCTAYLFNHESPLRPEHFVTRKVVVAAARIRSGEMREKLQLGNLDIVRDWGWAPEYMEALWRMTCRPSAEDFIIATGTSISLAEFVEAVFSEAGLDWREHVVSRATLHRPSEIVVSRAAVARTTEILGWRASICGDAVPRHLFRNAVGSAVSH